MKIKLAILVSFLLLLSSPHLSAQNTIKLNIKNIGKDSILIAYPDRDKKFFLADEEGNNTYVKFDKNENGTFKSTALKKGVYMLVFPPQNDYIEFLYDGKDLDISLDRKSMQETISFKNSSANQLLYKYISFISKLSAEKEQLLKVNDDHPTKRKRLAALDQRHEKYMNDLFKKNPNNIAAKFLKANSQIKMPADLTDKQKQLEYYKANYLKNLNFTDAWLIRTPFFYPKIMTYLDNLTAPNIHAIANSVDYLIDLSTKNDEMYTFLVSTLLNKYAKSDLMIAENIYAHIVKKYYIDRTPTWIEETKLANIVATYEQVKHSLIGTKVADFNIINSDNKSNSVYNSTAQYKIFCFWLPPFNQDKLNITSKEIPSNTAFFSISKNFTPKQRDDFNAKYSPDFPVNILSNDQKLTLFKLLNINKNSTNPSVYLVDKSNMIIAKRITPAQALSFVNQLNGTSN